MRYAIVVVQWTTTNALEGESLAQALFTWDKLTELRLEEATEDSDLPTAHPSFQGLLL